MWVFSRAAHDPEMAVGLTPTARLQHSIPYLNNEFSQILPELIVEFLARNYCFELLSLIRSDDSGFKCLRVKYNFYGVICALTTIFSTLELFDFAPGLAHELLETPKKILKLFKESCMAAQDAVIEQARQATQEVVLMPKPDILFRFHGLPLVSPDYAFQKIPGVDAQNKLISLTGTVVRVGSPRMIERTGKYECIRCKCEYEIEADMMQYGQVPKPMICTATIDGQDCRHAKFVRCPGFRPECEDYQELKIQESTTSLDIGAVPRSLTVVMRGDLVDTCNAGDNIQVIGVLQSRWKPLKSGTKAELEMFLEANNVAVQNKNFSERGDFEVSINFAAQINAFWERWKDTSLNGRNVIVDSFCPQIHGMYLPKLAVLLILVGGCFAEAEDEPVEHAGSRKHRKEGHILLVGDPGTAKSQLLIGASKLTSRAVLTTGSGSTNAGLTVTAVKDGGDWTLEAGALVLADNGICCIDEFSQLKPNDRTSIHEAMEQQTLSVAKAGLVCKLNTRCSIIAACNSKGKFEEGESISSNTALASPLLSRFDLILVLLDRRSPEWDARLSSSILRAACGSSNQMAANSSKELWDFDMLKAYIAYTKQKGQPRMGQAARIIISKYYQRQRAGTNRDAARTTVRLLESLIRLSQAHAKLLWQSEILAQDAITAILLMESSLQTQAILGVKPDLYAEAPQDPVSQYAELSAQILSKLQINPAVFEDEENHILHDLASESVELDEILCSWAPTQL